MDENEIQKWQSGEPGKALRSMHEDCSRTPQHEEWAWTRCCARMRETKQSPAGMHALYWKLGAFGSVALLTLVTFWPAEEEDPDSQPLASLESVISSGGEIAAHSSSPPNAAMEVAGLAAPAVATPAAMGVAATGAPALPSVDQHVPNVWVSTFHADEPHAEVIWAEGYDYVPPPTHSADPPSPRP